MRNLITAIARLLGLQTQPSDNPVQPTQPAGPASQEPIRPRGSKRSVATTKRQPAKPKHKPKSSLAKADTQAKSRKLVQKRVQPAVKESGETGLQQATPVPQSVKSKPKRKPKAAQSTIAVSSRKPKQKPAQAESGATGKPRKTPVRQTRQHAK